VVTEALLEDILMARARVFERERSVRERVSTIDIVFG